jgi:hypothetical protein
MTKAAGFPRHVDVSARISCIWSAAVAAWILRASWNLAGHVSSLASVPGADGVAFYDPPLGRVDGKFLESGFFKP